SGRRTKNWVKVKCTRRQEFIIVGWKPSSTKQRPFSSLLLAQCEGDELAYKGNVGTRFDTRVMAERAKPFARRERKRAPLEVDKAAARRVRWLRPDLVAEIACAEFTASGSVRHASFLGLRHDKEAKDVTPETPQPAPAPDSDIVITNRERVIFP